MDIFTLCQKIGLDPWKVLTLRGTDVHLLPAPAGAKAFSLLYPFDRFIYFCAFKDPSSVADMIEAANLPKPPDIQLYIDQVQNGSVKPEMVGVELNAEKIPLDIRAFQIASHNIELMLTSKMPYEMIAEVMNRKLDTTYEEEDISAYAHYFYDVKFLVKKDFNEYLLLLPEDDRKLKARVWNRPQLAMTMLGIVCEINWDEAWMRIAMGAWGAYDEAIEGGKYKDARFLSDIILNSHKVLLESNYIKTNVTPAYTLNRPKIIEPIRLEQLQEPNNDTKAS